MRAFWALSEWASRLLAPAEREAVLGDLAEEGGGPWQNFVEIIDLVLRRQAGQWKEWRPWVAAFGISVPTSFFFMGDSVLLCAGVVKLAGGGADGGHVIPGMAILASKALVLAGWSWTCGYLVGYVSRRTVWCSVLAYGSPCLFCLSRFHSESLSPLSLFLFVIPLVLGLVRGLKGPILGRRLIVYAASIITLLAIISHVGATGGVGSPASWIGSVIQTCPAWCLAVASLKAAKVSSNSQHPVFKREQHEPV
jgi:hypothetical protein